MRIVIDPGHGGNERANRGPSGYVEADGVLQISKYLKDFLLQAGYEVKLTRDNDMTLGLSERAKIAAEWKADLFISEHTNAGGGKGVETYYSIDIPGDERFAAEMAAAISANIGIPNRGARVRESQKHPGEDFYTVIDAAQDLGIPHIILVESAYHDNPHEEAILKNPDKLKAIAYTQSCVIQKYFPLKKCEVRKPNWESILDNANLSNTADWKKEIMSMVVRADKGEVSKIWGYLPLLIEKIGGIKNG